MTFRHGLVHRWSYPALIVPCVALVWWAATRTEMRDAGRAWGYVGAVPLVFGLLLAIQSWRVWTTRVTVGDTLIEWSRGTDYGSLVAKDVAKLGIRRTLAGIRVGLVDRDSGLLHPLPLMPRRLYDVLSEKFGRLSPGDESDLFN